MADIYVVSAVDDANDEPVNVRVEFESTARRLEDVMEKSGYYRDAEYEQVF